MIFGYTYIFHMESFGIFISLANVWWGEEKRQKACHAPAACLVTYIILNQLYSVTVKLTAELTFKKYGHHEAVLSGSPSQILQFVVLKLCIS